MIPPFQILFKLCFYILRDPSLFNDLFHSFIYSLNDRLDKLDGTILELQSKVSNIKSDFEHLQKQQQTCQDNNEKLERQINDLEQYSRRNCVRVFGVPEHEKENTDELVRDIATKHLGVNLQLDHIDRSHRVRRRVDPSGAQPRKPRAIIVKLTSYRHRQLLLYNKKKLKEDNTGYSIYEDLTAKNRTLLWEAQKASRDPERKIESAWTRDGRTIVTIKAGNNKTIKKLIHSKEELEKI